MKVVVLGSGLLGITTAHVLAARGHGVEVIERKPGSGMETSFANGGQLSYSHAEPWATPAVLAKLPKWMLHKDSPLIFRLRADVEMIKWGLKFLSNCTTSKAERYGMHILRLGLYSRLKMQQLIAETGLHFDYAERGILHVYGKQADLSAAIRQAEFQAKFGCDQTILSSRDAVINKEPALAHTSRPIVGGVFSQMDAMGDAHVFCNVLAEYASARHGVKVHYNTSVQGIVAENGRIASVLTDRGEFMADAYVLALGSYSPMWVRDLGLRLPIYPMKGYSITIPANEFAPALSVTDGSHKIVFSRLGDRMRVAGTAEFAGYDERVRPERIRPIEAASRRLFPKLAWENHTLDWACLRPSTPNGVPILGACPVENLYLNTGHGTLGWTQATGSAHIVADIMEGKPPEIMIGGMTYADL